MLDVVQVDVARVTAAGESAALVAGLEQPAQWGGDGASLAAHVQRLAILVLDEGDEAGVAGEAAGSLGGDGRAVFDLAAAGGAVAHGLGGDVHDDLLAIGAGGIVPPQNA